MKEQGVFPAPPPQPRLPPEQRLSWMAALVSATNAGEIRPEAEQGWADPLNDPFVRQTIENFRNPAIAPPSGPAGHPVSQFAGMAGVGADAPTLPVDNPRAGIFGFERTTRDTNICNLCDSAERDHPLCTPGNRCRLVARRRDRH